jgi:hypothetical protein
MNIIKYFFSIAICIMSFHSFSTESKTMDDNDLWSKQIAYRDNMSELSSNLDLINKKINICKIAFFQANEDKKERDIYLNETKKFSTTILVTSSILKRAIAEINYKMENDKKTVLKNLSVHKDSLDDDLKSEKERNNNYVDDFNKKFSVIKEKFCI